LNNNINANQVIFSQEQVDNLSSLYCINRIDDHLKVLSSVKIASLAENAPPRILLILEIYFYDDKVDTLSFNLQNYEYDEIVYLTKNIRSNEFLLQEIDNFLAGDLVE